MDTAYELICNLPEQELRYLTVDLTEHQAYFKDKLIFSSGQFVNMQRADDFNSRILIQPEAGKWQETVAELYRQYYSCIPQRMRRYNFIPANARDMDYILSPMNFHERRIRLELYILFHGALKDLVWSNPSHFMQVVCANCVIYRDWL